VTARFVEVALVITPLVAKRFVEVAAVVVERVRVVSARVERPETVSVPSVPIEVREDEVMPAANMEPVREPAGAEPLMDPLMVLVTERLVVVAFVIVEFVDAKLVEVAAVVVESPAFKNAKVVEAVHTLPWARLTPIVRAVEPLYVPEKVRVESVAVRFASDTSVAPTVAQEAEPEAFKLRTN
jgi:hypothetical protein